MARSKEFDPEEALASAVQVFWRRGYESASLDALMQGMGIARQSLYDTFGDKRALYMKALARYRDDSHAAMRRMLRSGSVREGFARLLRGIAAETPEEHARGCLLLSASMERAAADLEVAAFLEANQAAMATVFAEAIGRGQAEGEIPAGRDPAALARFLIVTIQGMRAMARLRSDREALEQVAEIALAALD